MSLSVDIEKKLGGFSLRVQLDTDDAITGLLGASGCGKSLTLQCIAGIQRPDRGRIVLDVGGEERRHMTVPDLLERFAQNAGHALDNDRILLSKDA